MNTNLKATFYLVLAIACEVILQLSEFWTKPLTLELLLFVFLFLGLALWLGYTSFKMMWKEFLRSDKN